MASCSGISSDRKCVICSETLSSPHHENDTNFSEEKIPNIFGNSTKTNNLTQLFLQCLGEDESCHDDLDSSNFDSDPEEEEQVNFCTKCQNYLTQWNDLNNQINLLELRKSQIKFTLYAMSLMSLEKLKKTECKNPAFDDTSLRANGDETNDENKTFVPNGNAKKSLKTIVQDIKNRVCNRFNVRVLLKKSPLLGIESCKPEVAVTRPELTCVTVATDKYVYAKKYAFVFHDEKICCAECSAVRSKKWSVLRHIRVSHIHAHESEDKKPRMKNHGDIFTNNGELNVTQIERNAGQLELEECDLDDPEVGLTDCPRLRPRSSAPAMDILDIDSNDFQDDAQDDWNESLSEDSDTEAEQKADNKSRSQDPSRGSPKTSKVFRPKRDYYTPTEDGSVMDPYGHHFKQTGANEYLYANEYKFRFQDDSRYHCDQCQYSVLRRIRMLKHIRLQHMNDQQNKVPVKPSFSRSRPIGPALDLGKFQVILTPSGKWKCGECQFERNRKKDIRYHIRRLHIEGGSQKSDKIQSYSCKEVRPNEYLYHDKFPFRFDTDEGVYVCGTCDHKSSLRRSMIPHIRGNHFSEEDTRLHSAVEVAPGEFLFAGKYKIFFADGRYACGICGCVKEVIWELYPHIRKCHVPSSNPDEKTPVDMQTEDVMNVDDLKTDTARGTTNLTAKIPEDVTPPAGGTATSGSQQSVQVAKIKKMPSNLPLPDPITGRIDLEHMGIPFSYESAINKWTCSLCPVVKAYRTKLTEHIRQKHINRERFVCDICGFEANDRTIFRRHRARHEGARFKCHLCDKQFTDRTYLQTHLKIHKGEEAKKFQCEFCGKKFHFKKQYSNHVPTHTGEKPFPCAICGDRFSNTFKRREHSKAVHGGVPHPMKPAYFERQTQ